MTTTMFESHLRLHFLPLLLLSCVSLSSFLMINASVACGPHQIQALTQFKNEFDSRSCNLTEYFNGARCDNTTGAITELKLPSGCLSGTLKPNSTLFGFHQLRYLDLSYNNFFNSIPAELGNLNKLEFLFLSSNGFFGQVPTTISNLTLLTMLYLPTNDLTGSFPLIQNLTKLSILELSYNHFHGTLPPSLLTMPFLSALDLRDNHFSGPIEVPNSSTSSRFEFLNLGINYFEGKIIEPVLKLINLKHIDISFPNTSYQIDLNIFSSLKTLSYLDISGYSISPSSLTSDSNIPLTLEVLAMAKCNIKELPNILKTLPILQRLDLSVNRINGKIPEWLWRLPYLSSVFMPGNLLTGFQGSTEALVNSSVQFLNLQLNRLQGALPSLPHSINMFSASYNRFNGDIPLSICNRRSLAFLSLSHNNFTGPIPPCLSNLTVLNLRKNNFEGRIPDMFNADAPLQTLDVGYNRLTGKLPRSLLNCSSLRFLGVDKNKIKDTFPFWLKALPNLQILILRSNEFYGPISPPNQGPLAFPELRIFEISNNNFTGSLSPSYFVNWKTSSPRDGYEGLYMVYKQRNAIATYVYTNLLDLQNKGLSMEQEKVFTSYATIDFSGNRLEGQIPESIGLLKALIALNLSNNAFTGHIPLSFSNLAELESLDLSRNQLSGTIPHALGSLSFLAYINVSHNQLKGEIPQGPQITGQPESCFEGNLGLCGLTLEETCFGTNALPTQQAKEEDDEEEEQALNWKGVLIGYGPGMLLGLAIAQAIGSYKPEWLASSRYPNKRRNR